MRRTRYGLIILICLATALTASGYLKGIRYPPLQWVPQAASTQSDDIHGADILVQAEGAMFQGREGGVFTFRAFVPEPELTVTNGTGGEWRVDITNLHPAATLESEHNGLTETAEGLRRAVSGTVSKVTLGWRFPNPDRYRFAAIGDTGGGTELRWVLQRAWDLGADFVLHLGDFNYRDGDYMSTVEALEGAPIPSYVSIGNHDFYEGWRSVHHLFRQHIGPRNATFRLGRVRFINLDTAAGFVPADTGVRGRFLSSLDRDSKADDIVVFTHKPLTDPRQGETHRVSALEYDYLHAELSRLGVKSILAGHIHIREEFDDGGIRTFISGEGLAHADFIVGRPHASILLGEITPGESEVVYRWAPIEMPFQAHCNPRGWEVLEAMDRANVIRELEAICAAQR